MTNCQCEVPGYCQTHQRQMVNRVTGSDLRWRQCRYEPGYFEAFQGDLRRRAECGEQTALIGPNETPSLCIHRGAPIGERACDQCSQRGKQQMVHLCDTHGECIDREGVRGVKSCRWCEDYRARHPQPIDWPFDRVVCINLDRRPDRWQEFCRHFTGVGRFPATDGWQPETPAWWGAGGGAWGCRDSHVRAIRQACEDGVESILILEDDAEPAPGFSERLAGVMRAVPDDWEQIYLGGQHQHWTKPRDVSQGVGVPYNVSRTHAYALRGEGITCVLDYLEDLEAWSEFPGDHIDHYYGRAHERGDWRVYCAEPWLIEQGANQSDIDGQAHERRGWHVRGDPYWRPAWEVRSTPGVTRVSWYVPDVQLGGVEVWMRTLIEGFDRSQINPVAVAVESEHQGPALGLPVPVTTDFRTVAHNSDVVIAWGVKSLSSLRQQYDGRVVCVSHGTDDWTRRMLARLAPLSERWAAVSESARDAYPRRLRSKVWVIRNGIGPLELPGRDTARRALGLVGGLAIGYVGRFSAEKDPLAVCRAVQAMPDSVAVMHGHESDGGDWIDQARSMVPPDRLRIVGPQVPVEQTYAALDCFVSTPPREGFGLSVCEAMQAGVPVVSTRTGLVNRHDDICEIVEAGAGGEALAVAIGRAINGGERVERARGIARQQYSAEPMVRRWETCLASESGGVDKRSNRLRAPRPDGDRARLAAQ